MTDSPTWRDHVEKMCEKARAHQAEPFYRIALAGWLAELRRIEEEKAKGGDRQERA